MTEPLPPLPPKSNWIIDAIKAAEDLAKQVSGLVVLVTGMLVAGTTLMVAIHGGTQKQILQDVNASKDVQSKIVAEAVGAPNAFNELKQVDANLKAATQPAK